MTIIKASLNDQALTVSTAPVVASGGVEEDVVTFEFDSAWAEYAKKAVFYRDKSNVYHVDIGSDNTAVVPWEVLQQAGHMYFGVFGTKGSEVKTSTVAKYRVEHGAITIASGLMSTPDIFSDVVANTKARHSHDNKTVLDGITAEKVAEWDDNATGADGEDGATFTPSVSAAGTLSWTNDKGLANPAPVNIKGPAGAAGAAGKDGYTPVRGTDYWTADDIAAIQSYIDDKIVTELSGIDALLGSGEITS